MGVVVVVVVVFFICSSNMRMRGDRVGNQYSQRTGRFEIFVFVVCRFSRAIEFVIDLGALGKIGKTLAESRADARLGLGSNTDVLFQ